MPQGQFYTVGQVVEDPFGEEEEESPQGVDYGALIGGPLEAETPEQPEPEPQQAYSEGDVVENPFGDEEGAWGDEQDWSAQQQPTMPQEAAPAPAPAPAAPEPQVAYNEGDVVEDPFGEGMPTAMPQSTLGGRVAQAWDEGWDVVHRGSMGAQILYGNDNPELRQRIRDLDERRKSRPKHEGAGIPEKILTGFAKTIPVPIEMTRFGAERAGVMGLGVGAMAAPTGVPAGPLAAGAAKVGFVSGSMQKIFEVEGGNAYLDLEEMGVDPEVARPVAMGVGAVNAAIELPVMGWLLNLVPGGKPALKKLLNITSKEVAKKVAPTLAKRLGKKVGAGAVGYVGEIGQEVVQETTNIVGEKIAREISNKYKGTDVKAPTAEEIKERLTETAISSMTDFALLSGLPTVAGVAGEVSKHRRDTKEQDLLGRKRTKAEALAKELEAMYADGRLDDEGLQNLISISPEGHPVAKEAQRILTRKDREQKRTQEPVDLVEKAKPTAEPKPAEPARAPGEEKAPATGIPARGEPSGPAVAEAPAPPTEPGPAERAAEVFESPEGIAQQERVEAGLMRGRLQEFGEEAVAEAKLGAIEDALRLGDEAYDEQAEREEINQWQKEMLDADLRRREEESARAHGIAGLFGFLNATRETIERGDLGERISVTLPGPEGEQVVSDSSTYPAFLEDLGYSKEAALDVMDRAMGGEALTGKDADVWEFLVEHARDWQLAELTEYEKLVEKDPLDIDAIGPDEMDSLTRELEANGVDPRAVESAIGSRRRPIQGRAIAAIAADAGVAEDAIADAIDANPGIIERAWNDVAAPESAPDFEAIEAERRAEDAARLREDEGRVYEPEGRPMGEVAPARQYEQEYAEPALQERPGEGRPDLEREAQRRPDRGEGAKLEIVRPKEKKPTIDALKAAMAAAMAEKEQRVIPYKEEADATAAKVNEAVPGHDLEYDDFDEEQKWYQWTPKGKGSVVLGATFVTDTLDPADVEAKLREKIKVFSEALKPTEEAQIATSEAELESARAEVSPEPSEAQKEAGNYRKGHITAWPQSGFSKEISIETGKGMTRRGEDREGQAWEQVMEHDYGHILGVPGKDGDLMDVFIGPDMDTSGKVFVVNQKVPDTGKFDEHKVMIGFTDRAAARKGYLDNYEPGWNGIMSMMEYTPEQFHAWTKQLQADPALATKTAPTAKMIRKAAPKKLEKREPLVLKPTEPTPQERVELERQAGRIAKPEKTGIRPVIPEEKIKAPTTGKQAGLFGPAPGETISIEEAIEAKKKEAAEEKVPVKIPSKKKAPAAKSAANATNMLNWIVAMGGLPYELQDFTGELRDAVWQMRKGRKVWRKGIPRGFINKSSTWTLDDLAADAVNDGWLPEGSEGEDLWQLIVRDLDAAAEGEARVTRMGESVLSDTLKELEDRYGPEAFGELYEGHLADLAEEVARDAQKQGASQSEAQAHAEEVLLDPEWAHAGRNLFYSGAEDVTNLKAHIDAGRPVTVIASKVAKRKVKATKGRTAYQALVEYAAQGGRVLVDSGAYSAFRGKTKPVDFDKVMRWYASFIKDVRKQSPANIFDVQLVMPDVIGDQKQTLQLLTKYADQISALRQAGATPFVALQKGELAPYDALKEVRKILGIKQFTVALPSREAAYTAEEVKMLLSGAEKPNRIHFLGMSDVHPDAAARKAVVQEMSPNTDVSWDATRMRTILPKIQQAQRDLIADYYTTKKELDWDDTEIAANLLVGNMMTERQAEELAMDLDLSRKDAVKALKEGRISEWLESELGDYYGDPGFYSVVMDMVGREIDKMIEEGRPSDKLIRRLAMYRELRRDSLEAGEDQFSRFAYDLTPQPTYTANEADVRKAFPTAKRITRFENFKLFWQVELPNGAKVHVFPNRDIVYNPSELKEQIEMVGDVYYGTEYVAGRYFRDNVIDELGIIEIAKLGKQETLTRHEPFHAACNMALTDKQRSQLFEKYGNEEKAAIAFTKWDGRTPETFFEKIRDFALNIYEALFKPEEQIFRKIRSGKIWHQKFRHVGPSGIALNDISKPEVHFAVHQLKWPYDPDNTEFGTVNKRLKNELEIFEKLFGPSDKAVVLPAGKYMKEKQFRSIAAYDLGQELDRVVKSGEAARILNPDVSRETLAKERGLTGKAKDDFIREVTAMRKTNLMIEVDRNGLPILTPNGKAGMSADFLLATCHPTAPCKECYAAKTYFRYAHSQKAMRDTLNILVNPKGWAERVAAEARKVSKADLPFIRLQGSGDITFDEQIEGYNHLAKVADRPIQVFSRHHDNLAKLVSTKNAPFIKMGSVDHQLYAHYGVEYLKENFDKRGIVNAWLYTAPDEIPMMRRLQEGARNALGLVLSATHKLHKTLPPKLQAASCPCDADERTYVGSCRRCAMSEAGCFMAYSPYGVDNDGKLWRILDPNAPEILRPITAWFMDSKELKSSGYVAVFETIVRKNVELVNQKIAKFWAREADHIVLKDIRWPNDQTKVYSTEAARIYQANMMAALARAKKGDLYLPGGEIQPSISMRNGVIMDGLEAQPEDIISTQPPDGKTITEEEVGLTKFALSPGQQLRANRSGRIEVKKVAWPLIKQPKAEAKAPAAIPEREVTTPGYVKGTKVERRAISSELSKKEKANIGNLMRFVRKTMANAGLNEETINQLDIEFKRIIDPRGKDITRTLEEHAALGKKADKILGATTFYKLNAVVELAMNQDRRTLEGTAYHEAFHVALQWLLPEKDYATIMRLYSWNEEAAADAFAEYMQLGRWPKSSPSAAQRIYLKLRAFLQRLRSWVNGKGFARPQDIFGQLRVGMYQEPVFRRIARDKETLVKFNAENRYAPWMYSRALQVAEGQFDKMPGKVQSLMNWLRKQGVKPAELDALEVDQWLRKNQDRGKIDKSAFLNYLMEQDVIVNEQQRGTLPAPGEIGISPEYESYREAGGKVPYRELLFYTPSRLNQRLQYVTAKLELISEEIRKTVTEARKRRGVERKRLTPEEYADAVKRMETSLDVRATPQTPAERAARHKALYTPEESARIEALGKEYNELEEERKKLKSQEEYLTHRSNHFGNAANLMGWARLTERRVGEEKWLYVEELQSDWMQQARDSGMIDVEKYDALREASGKAIDAYRAFQTEMIKKYVKEEIRDAGGARARAADLLSMLSMTDAERAKLQKLQEEQTRLIDQQQAAMMGVPPSPWMHDWYKLLMKRIIRLAAEEGFDGIGMTTAARQFRQWGTDQFTWEQEMGVDDKPTGRWIIWHKSQVEGHAMGFDLQLEAEARGLQAAGDKGENFGVVGNYKDVEERLLFRLDDKRKAEKLWARMQESPQGGVYRPRHEGMKAFYDGQLVGWMNKYVKKWDARVGDVKFSRQMVAANEAAIRAEYDAMTREELEDEYSNAFSEYPAEYPEVQAMIDQLVAHDITSARHNAVPVEMDYSEWTSMDLVDEIELRGLLPVGIDAMDLSRQEIIDYLERDDKGEDLVSFGAVGIKMTPLMRQAALFEGQTKFRIEENEGLATRARAYLADLARKAKESRAEHRRGYIRQGLSDAIPQDRDVAPEPSSFEEGKDEWLGEKDIQKQYHDNENWMLKEWLKGALGETKITNRVKDYDKAIHVYLDLKRNPLHYDLFYDDLSPEQQRIADLARTIEQNPELHALAEYIAEQYEETGLQSMEEGIIHNTIENYVARTWNIPTKRMSQDTLAKFKASSRHAKQRVFQTILQGQSLGYSLKIEGATNNLTALKDEISRVREDKRLLKTLLKMNWKDNVDSKGNPLKMLTVFDPGHDYRKIEHPNFVWWHPFQVIRGAKEVKDYGRDTRILRKWAVVAEGKTRARRLFEEQEDAERYAAEAWEAQKLPSGKMRKGAVKFRVEARDYIYKRTALYAPKEYARRLNKMVGVSRLKGLEIWPGIAPIDVVTKYNAFFKGMILITSFFHHQAFIRSLILPSGWMKAKDHNFVQGYREGLDSIRQMNPTIQLLIRNGLTLGTVQDWQEDVLRSETNLFGDAVRAASRGLGVKFPTEFIDWMENLRQRQADFLFGKFGAGLKAKAALIHYAHLTKQYEGQKSPNEIAKMTAEIINEDFGGLHLQRMERDPTIQHIFRLAALAPDWTESNIRTMYKMFVTGDKARKKMYRRFWASVLVKGILATVAANFLLGFWDEDDQLERFMKAWRAGHLKWLDVDFTPLYRALGYKGEKRKYLSILGHFKDPIKFATNLSTAMHHKGSVLYKTVYEWTAGTDWKGARYTTVSELLGWDDKGYYLTDTATHKRGQRKGGKLKGQLTTFAPGKKGPIGLSRLPSFVLAQLRGMTPVQVQALFSRISGEQDTWDLIQKGVGLHGSSTYPTGKKMETEFIERWIETKKKGGSFKDLKEELKGYNERQEGLEEPEPIKWSTISKKGLNRWRAERIYEKKWKGKS